MDELLCDELLHEIFRLLPPPAAAALSLVSKRWLRLTRTSATSLSLRFTRPTPAPPLISFLSDHPLLASLSVVSPDSSSPDPLLLAVSTACPALTHLRLLTPPLSASSLSSLSWGCANLVCLNITVSRAFVFSCLTFFPSLKDLSVAFSGDLPPSPAGHGDCDDAQLRLESLSLSGIRSGDRNAGWLWRRCTRLKKLKLKCCEGVGDGTSFSCLDSCFPGLQQVELRTCRTIVDLLLSKLADLCQSLNSLLVYDGGSREGLLHFITHSNCKSHLRKLDFRLPLDLDDVHLHALAQNFIALASLRLQSCCLVTGQGLKSLGAAMRDGLQEIALVSCDVVEREPGLMTALGQNLNSLTTLDLSYNETLQDKEFVSMLGSCCYLSEVKLRGCRRLTNATLVSLSRSCKHLKVVDIVHCLKLDAEFVELLILNSPSMSRIMVEESKITDTAKSWMRRKSIDQVIA
uniref:F-box domain-containing protein n=1 Tax=Kalanchoe fedtschenkoi TaxID=63787 RepID=A0A7N0T4R8_KALFE